MTSIFPVLYSLNRHEPKNDLNMKGPFVILIAVTSFCFTNKKYLNL
jgi:hypothetical protein